ncbi:MAG TPA: enoyl-CoA hydratase-related protein [Ramlibacter sp.]|uniref:enoyl-CoA hydratase-related protein n=1 Tax=Ramlibacter sp. TaxID=1917967 RepID=UPI002B95D4F2|nr:enoyl-CoA hydratase-related protein [Ramlibacter sp.]HVZ44229.1 enoyl-CoA hydratase-related protein [Ramlibacter sp.]
MSKLVTFEVRGAVAVVTLNDAGRMNPLSSGLMQELANAMSRIETDTAIRALLLTASGRGFCVGADLKDFAERSQSLPDGDSLGQHVGRMMEEDGNALICRLRNLPVPVVCAVNGPAAGGGVGLALAADIVIAARSAYFYLPFVPALGLVPDMGASWMLPRLIGRARAVGLALTGEKLAADTAAQWGLIWACVDDAALQDEGSRLATTLAELAADSIREVRSIFAAAETNGLEQQLSLERERQEKLIDGEAFAQGLRAFHERRKPAFKGRA